MSNKYILINLNQGESKESRQERLKEQSRWTIFGLLILLFLLFNGGLLWVNFGYESLINKKQQEIAKVKSDLAALQAQGKNISKDDIQALAKIEEERFMWSRILELLGEMTPDDIALTGLQFKHDNLRISGIATIYADIKDFDIVNNYVNMLRNNSEFSENFSRIKFAEYSRQKFRGQEIILFTVSASVTSKPKSARNVRRGIS